MKAAIVLHLDASEAEVDAVANAVRREFRARIVSDWKGPWRYVDRVELFKRGESPRLEQMELFEEVRV